MTEANQETILISVEGNIGSGKTTILKALEEALADEECISFSEEPAESWEASGALSALYEGSVTPSFFQMFVLSSRTASILRHLIRSPPPKILISERTLFLGERAFADVCITKAEERKMYDQCSAAYGSLVTAKAAMLYIFIDTDPEICLARVKARGRRSEASLDIDYLRKLDASHRSLVAEKGARAIHIDGNQDKSTVFAQVLTLVQGLAGGLNKENIDPSTTKKKKKSMLPIVTPTDTQQHRDLSSASTDHIHDNTIPTSIGHQTKKIFSNKGIRPRTILGDTNCNTQQNNEDQI